MQRWEFDSSSTLGLGRHLAKQLAVQSCSSSSKFSEPFADLRKSSLIIGQKGVSFITTSVCQFVGHCYRYCWSFSCRRESVNHPRCRIGVHPPSPSRFARWVRPRSPSLFWRRSSSVRSSCPTGNIIIDRSVVSESVSRMNECSQRIVFVASYLQFLPFSNLGFVAISVCHIVRGAHSHEIDWASRISVREKKEVFVKGWREIPNWVFLRLFLLNFLVHCSYNSWAAWCTVGVVLDETNEPVQW